MANRFSPGCKCCDAGCWVFKDDFNRTDDTDIGEEWTEISGEWEILANELTIEDSDAVIKCDLPETCQNFSIKFKGSAGDVIRFGYHDGTNWNTYVELKIGTAQYIKVFNFVGVQNNCEITLAADTWHELIIVTSTSGYMSVAVNGTYTLNGGPYAVFSGSHIHVGTGSIAGTVYFDDLIASKHDDVLDSEIEICKDGARCFWPFEVNTPTELTLDVSDLPVEYAEYEGLFTLELLFDAATSGTGQGCLYESAVFGETEESPGYFWIFGFCDPSFVVALVGVGSTNNPCFGHSFVFYKDALADDCRFKDSPLVLNAGITLSPGIATVTP